MSKKQAQVLHFDLYGSQALSKNIVALTETGRIMKEIDKFGVI